MRLGPEENQQCLASSREAITGSSDKVESTSSNRVGKATSIGKEDSAEFRSSIFPASLGSSHMSSFYFPGYLSVPINVFTLTVHTLQGWSICFFFFKFFPHFIYLFIHFGNTTWLAGS